MALKELVPWRWGGLRREEDDMELGSFRHQIDTLHQEMDRLFDEVTSFGARRLAAMPRLRRELLVPEIDATEDEKGYHVSVELPGLAHEDVEVSLSGRELTIRGEKRQEEEQKDKDFYRSERMYGSFRRTIELPGAVDEANIEASFKNGVLYIELPKTEEAQAKVRHIEIKAA